MTAGSLTTTTSTDGDDKVLTIRVATGSKARHHRRIVTVISGGTLRLITLHLTETLSDEEEGIVITMHNLGSSVIA
jgi:hypothetical protein